MPYNPAFDGLRAVAILAVVSFHCRAPWGDGGYLGVDLFFVLSGYLITSLLLTEHRHGGIAIGAFYVRRALRLYPTLLLLVLSYALLAPTLWPTDNRWLITALTTSYVMDYALVFAKVSSVLGHTWSLGIEEKFYLLWPLLLPKIVAARRPVAWLAGAFLLVTAWRYFVAFQWGWAQAYFCFDTHMTGVLLGAIGALASLKVPRYTVTIACCVLVVAIATPLIHTTARSVSVAGVTIGITVGELASVALVCYMARHSDNRVLAAPVLVYIGKLSYGIYLWHFPLVILLRDLYLQPWWVTLVATLVFSLTLAALCLHFVDRPLRRCREKTFAWHRARGASYIQHTGDRV
jgi:peptidoglycan/LPS O-acetylase OafA/YrhL